MSDYRELLIGCGHARDKRVFPPTHALPSDHPIHPIGTWKNLTTLDNNPDCMPDVLFDLRSINASFTELALPFDDAEFDEVHAYEVLEHVGRQGDALCFFAQFAELWRVLKPNGYFCATVPHWTSLWAWGDPSHTRIINEGTLVFLERAQYDKQLGKTAMSDFRALMGEQDWKIERCRKQGELLEFVLRALK